MVEVLVMIAYLLLGLGTATIVGSGVLTILKLFSIINIQVKSAWVGSLTMLFVSGGLYTVALYLSHYIK